MKPYQFLFFLFVCSKVVAQNSYNVNLLDFWTDSTLTKGVGDAIFSDLWGFNQNGEEYIALGSTEGTHIFKIDNNKLQLLDFKPGKFSSTQVVHRDYKTYKNYLYAVCDEGQSSLQIFDLSYLPDSIHKVYDSDVFFQICHNIYIDTFKAKLYACGTNNTGMTIFDISNPIQPILTHDFNQVNYVHDCFVVNDSAFLNCGFDGLRIYDFSTSTPTQLGILDFYADQGYNHSGWLSEDRKKYVFIDENKGRKVKVCDSENLGEIEVSELYGTKGFENNVAHNVQIFSDFAFISYYNEGLRVVDIKNAPQEIAFYDTFYQSTDYKLNGAWGVYVFDKSELVLISDRQNGLFLFEFPIKLFRENIDNATKVTQTPFINSQSKIIFASEQTKQLTFSIYDLSGKVVYLNQVFSDWINIPLSLNNGTYIYSITDSENNKLTQGKFVITK